MTENTNRRPYPLNLIDDLRRRVGEMEDALRDLIDHGTSARSDDAIEPVDNTIDQIESELARAQTVDHAMGVIQRDYYSDVKSIVVDLRDRVISGEISHEDQMHDALHEDVDGQQRVIYTFQAKLGLLASANEDAWQDFGFDNPTVEQMMYCALECDVQQDSDYPDPHDWDCYVRIDTNQQPGDHEIVIGAMQTLRAKGGYVSEPMDNLISAIDVDHDATADDDPDNLGLSTEYESDPTHRLHCEEIMRQWIDAGLRPDMIEVEG